MPVISECYLTVIQLEELFHMSKSNGVKVLSMESSLWMGRTASHLIKNPIGSPAAHRYHPATSSPWTWSPLPRAWPHLLRKKKTSQLKRNQKRKEELLANKAASAEVKKEVIPKSIEKATSQILFFNRDFS